MVINFKDRTLTLVEKELKEFFGYELSEVKHSVTDDNDNDNHDLVYVYKNTRNNETVIFDCLSETIQVTSSDFFIIEIFVLFIERTKELGWKQYKYNRLTAQFDIISDEIC